ncbi:MAG: hypothetical protein R2804_07760 [Cyclobacteriaceae bacterium]
MKMKVVFQQTTDSFNIIKYKVYWDKRDDSPYEEQYKLPTKFDSVGTEDIRLVLTQTFPFEGKIYEILKYQFDEKNSDDEESLYFYSPEFGIILFHFGTWRNSLTLIHTGNVQKDKIIYYLTDKIENNYQMVKEWN